MNNRRFKLIVCEHWRTELSGLRREKWRKVNCVRLYRQEARSVFFFLCAEVMVHYLLFYNITSLFLNQLSEVLINLNEEKGSMFDVLQL